MFRQLFCLGLISTLFNGLRLLVLRPMDITGLTTLASTDGRYMTGNLLLSFPLVYFLFLVACTCSFLCVLRTEFLPLQPFCPDRGIWWAVILSVTNTIHPKHDRLLLIPSTKRHQLDAVSRDAVVACRSRQPSHTRKRIISR